MIAIVTVLLAFPFGYFMRNRLTANVSYAIAYLWAFTYQGLYLTRMWVGGDNSAFDKDPDALPISYGLVAAGIFGVGFGLVALGQWVGARRRASATA
jgi:CHASE2 domain-containing sensor protein